MRLWDDMPTDPKWRVIARRSGQRVGDVIAMFNILLIQAGANADERGRTQGDDDEEIAIVLDVEQSAVAAIREAMQGKVLDGDCLTGWQKRQPKREDSSAERAKNWRERKRTQANASERPDTDTDTDTEILPKGSTRARKMASRPSDVQPGVWSDFQTLRAKKKAPLTETALKGIEHEVAKIEGLTLNAALSECCERGWQGFKAEWMKGGNDGRANGKRSGWVG